MLSDDAILFYADEPIYFVEDIIRVTPDQKQRDILRSLRDYPMTSVRSGHGVGKSAVESWACLLYTSKRTELRIHFECMTGRRKRDEKIKQNHDGTEHGEYAG